MISVITPAFNASVFLDRTMASVLAQKEVTDYIIIDDGSSDNTHDIALKWSEKDARITVLRHPDRKNHGRSESRNLGIENATESYIAFLDADDYYLPGRFAKDIRILEENRDIDAVYNAIGAHYYDSYDGPRPDWLNLTTLNERIPGNELFERMTPIGRSGWFSGNGLTVRKTFFDRVGLFNSQLEVAEDTELWIKMAMIGKLEASSIDDPVAMRGVHDKNIFNKNQKYFENVVRMYNSLIRFAQSKDVSSLRIGKLWSVRSRVIKSKHPDRYGDLLLLKDSAKFLLRNPGLIRVEGIRLQPWRSLRNVIGKTLT
ncbi:glycosyltransferase family 2 protein [Aureitalea marina]|uniref:Glycosyltransferase 2-like domain-containing protein n=1 Tax=Aureitalea marina TaxID=930804 RepID=A0A2S7KML7_9FLAO|nr:glycosyltransferase [Aureitalea marina]PQB03876.1 hypothetical protein BST85_02365 [Aureitalea marina]